jgi:hypothetical protein
VKKKTKLTKKEKVFQTIKEIISKEPKGLRYSEIVQKLREIFPNYSINTLGGYVVEFKNSIEKSGNSEILHPDRGFFIHSKFYNESITSPVKEEAFYKSFANYLVEDLQDCTNAIPLGGNFLKDKWGTPDVIGVYKFSQIDPIKPPPEIVTAEIKVDNTQIITAFGQACAYKIFSHKVYLVIPNNSKDIPRVESLCLRFQLGLVLFNASDPENPSYEIRTRAIKGEPDYYYLNEYLKRLPREHIRKLFG